MIQAGDLPSAIHGANGSAPVRGDNSAKILPMVELEKQTILKAVATLNGDKILAARGVKAEHRRGRRADRKPALGHRAIARQKL